VEAVGTTGGTLDKLGKELIARLEVGPLEVAFDLPAAAVALGITFGLGALALWLRRGIPRTPDAPLSRRAALIATMLDTGRTQLVAGFSAPLADRLLPLIGTLFLYILACNWVSVAPSPYIPSPTQNLNVPLGLALMVYVLSHYWGLRVRGVRRHLKSYLEPYPFLLPMNLIGDMGRTLSHGFRLFGNIMGGAILTAIAPALLARVIWLAPIAVPMGVGLNVFFGLFVGTIQALVFALLASAYINLGVQQT